MTRFTLLLCVAGLLAFFSNPIEAQEETDTRSLIERARALARDAEQEKAQKPDPPVPSPPNPEVSEKPKTPPTPPVIIVGEKKENDAAKPVPRQGAPAVNASTKPEPPKPTKVTKYTIKQGDTFSSIADDLYGDVTKWIAIAKANPLVDPIRLKIGQVIRLPDLKQQESNRLEELQALKKQITKPDGQVQTIVVEPGDTLSGISQRLYGHAKYWNLLYEANLDQLSSPDDLKVGMRLKVPPLRQAEPVAAD